MVCRFTLVVGLLLATQAQAFSDDYTAKAVSILKQASIICSGLETVYQFDCYRQAYRRAARAIGDRPDYRRASRALRGVEQALNQVVRQNADRSRPDIRVNGQRLRAIRPDAVPAAKQKFDQARVEAATRLLRAEGPARIHYTRIADVVNSNKVIIRSLLDRLLHRPEVSGTA